MHTTDKNTQIVQEKIHGFSGSTETKTDFKYFALLINYQLAT